MRTFTTETEKKSKKGGFIVWLIAGAIPIGLFAWLAAYDDSGVGIFVLIMCIGGWLATLPVVLSNKPVPKGIDIPTRSRFTPGFLNRVEKQQLKQQLENNRKFKEARGRWYIGTGR